jgi:hypothetical protein
MIPACARRSQLRGVGRFGCVLKGHGFRACWKIAREKVLYQGMAPAMPQKARKINVRLEPRESLQALHGDGAKSIPEGCDEDSPGWSPPHRTESWEKNINELRSPVGAMEPSRNPSFSRSRFSP